MSITTNSTQHAHGPTRARSCLDRGALPAIGRGGPGRWRLLLCLFGLIDRLVPQFRLMLATGLRRGEALGLHRRDVHLDARMLRVRWTLTRTSRGLELGEPKTDKSRRTVPLPRSAVETLTAHWVRQQEERRSAGENWRDNGLVFTTEIGTALEPRNVLRRFEQLA